MIDWTKPELLQQRNDPSMKIEEVSILPDWTGEPFPVYVRWSDGDICTYSIDGSFFEEGDEDKHLDIVPRPLTGEGWAYECDIMEHGFVINSDSRKPKKGHRALRVKWEVTGD